MDEVGDGLISARCTIPEFEELCPEIDLVSKIYVRNLCGFREILKEYLGHI